MVAWVASFRLADVKVALVQALTDLAVLAIARRLNSLFDARPQHAA